MSRWKCIYLFTSTFRAVISDRYLATLFVYRRNFNSLYAGRGRGRGDQGFWLCDVASLVMYCINAIRGLRQNHKNHCTGLLYPFLHSMTKTKTFLPSHLSLISSTLLRSAELYWPVSLYAIRVGSLLCLYFLSPVLIGPLLSKYKSRVFPLTFAISWDGINRSLWLT